MNLLGRWRSKPELGRQISQGMPAGIQLPEEFQLLFAWIERNRFYSDVDGYRYGYLSSPDEMETERVESGRLLGTWMEFASHPEGTVSWFERDDRDLRPRLHVFGRTGGDGSMGAFWIDDQGNQCIVNLGSGSGSTLVCVLADDAIEFLRLLAIGYDELCWGNFSEPPKADEDFLLVPNERFAEWVTQTFNVSIPRTGSEIVKHPSFMEDEDSLDPFWKWMQASNMLS